MKNKYLTKQQKNDIAISILYDWSFGDKRFIEINDILTRLHSDFMHNFRCFNTYKLLSLIRIMAIDIEDEYTLTNYRSIHPTFVETYAKENGFHISPMKAVTL